MFKPIYQDFTGVRDEMLRTVALMLVMAEDGVENRQAQEAISRSFVSFLDGTEQARVVSMIQQIRTSLAGTAEASGERSLRSPVQPY